MHAWSLLMGFCLVLSLIEKRLCPRPFQPFCAGAADASFIPKSWLLSCFNLHGESQNCPY